MLLIRSALCVLFTMSAIAPLRAAELIIESGPQGQNNGMYSEPSGAWGNSRTPPEAAKSSAPGLTSQAECGSRKLVFWRKDGQNSTAPASARFAPELPAAGRYSVFATWALSANAGPVFYVVRHAGGETRLPVFQDGRGGRGAPNPHKWVPLGSFEFTPGAGHYVELRLEKETRPVSELAFGQIVADAVKFASESPAGTPAALPTPPSPARASSALPAGAPAVDWQEDLQEALKLSAQNGRRILVFFHVSGNKASRDYENALFGDPAVRARLSERYIAVRADIGKNPEFAASLGVYRGSTINLYDSRGDALGQITERVTPAALLARLDQLDK